MQQEQYGALVRKVREVGCIPMATPFDEKSVELCVAFDLPILKVASSDINDWLLLEAIARTKRPVIISSGGASEKSLDEVVQFFENRSIPIAINHCVSIYPSEDDQLELDQIDYLKNRYSDHVIGFSSHEYNSWDKSMYLSYAKGARTWERHIDIDYQGVPVSPYCSKPENIDQWFKAFHDANKICGDSSTKRRVLSSGEVEYLDALVRGVYARNDLLKGYVFQKDSFEKNFYMAVPLQKGQLSAREVLNGEVLVRDMKANAPLMIHDINGPFAESSTLRKQLENRGLDVQSHSQ
jgi:N-acetylneuraminate synthase